MNHIPRTTLLRVKTRAIIADLEAISEYFDETCYAAEDLASLMERIDSMQVSVSEMRMGIEVSADARCVSDEEFEEMIDEDIDDDE